MVNGPSLDEIFGPGGILDRSLPDYEFRPSQQRMSQAVLSAIQERGHLCVEAGTGTGKTLAYLIPALYSSQRVLVSTATRNLQDQLLEKDIPFVRQHLNSRIRVTCMKGRQNYLCLRRFEDLRRQGTLIGECRAAIRQISGWLLETQTGDRSELTWLADSDPLWGTLDARSDSCIGQKCEHFDQCFVTRMRQRAFESDLVIVNHALFFSNLALESDEIGRVLPEFAVAILDEAHEVEDTAADHFGRRVSSFQLDDFARQLKRVYGEGSSLGKRADHLSRKSELLFAALPAGEGRNSLNHFPLGEMGYVDLRLELGDLFDGLLDSLRALSHAMESCSEKPDEADALLRRLDRLIVDLDDIFSLDSPENVYWFERMGRGVYLNLTPINMAAILREKLYRRIQTVVLTSATLATQGNFDYLRSRLGVPECEELIVAGEFDYGRQAALYVPKRIPEPRSPGYFDRLVEEIGSILRITDGGAFLLFTSFQQMQKVFNHLAESSDYPLLLQGQMPKTQLLERFRSTPRAVLCATSSFWQGVDVRGEALRCVVIDKLPFQVPTEPLVAARMHRIQMDGNNPFLEYSVPNAVIALRQGLGRLIRSKRDYGILAVLDGRLRTKSYGEFFLNSLPNCPLTDNIASLENFFRQSVSREIGGSRIGASDDASAPR